MTPFTCAEDGVALVVADHQITYSEWSRCGDSGNGGSDCGAQDGRTVAIHNPNKRSKSAVRLTMVNDKTVLSLIWGVAMR